MKKYVNINISKSAEVAIEINDVLEGGTFLSVTINGRPRETLLSAREKRNEMLATDIYTWCVKNDMWSDVSIHFNGKTWCMDDTRGYCHAPQFGTKIGKDIYLYACSNAKEFNEYANEETVSLTFEGGLYSLLNYPHSDRAILVEEFQKLFEKYGYYYEQGHAWSLAAYDL